MVHVGTSGFSYPEWRGTFYPERFPPARMLPYYAERFHTVELNNTFYRMPTAKTIAGWDQDTPAGFVFALKVPQRITHFARLRDVAEPLRYLLDTVGGLGAKLGPLLLQLPPNFRKDTGRLGDCLALVPSVRPHGRRVPPRVVARRRGVRRAPRSERGPLRRRHRGGHHARRRDRGLRLPAPPRPRLRAGRARGVGEDRPRGPSGATRSCTSSTRSPGPAPRSRGAGRSSARRGTARAVLVTPAARTTCGTLAWSPRTIPGS